MEPCMAHARQPFSNVAMMITSRAVDLTRKPHIVFNHGFWRVTAMAERLRYTDPSHLWRAAHSAIAVWNRKDDRLAIRNRTV